jgi:branched-chain amino acid transport system ATP-binding protein
MLELQDISKSFGQNHVLRDINMTFEQGQIYTLVGGNGTGKTTLFNLITGFLRPNQGKIIYKPKEIRKSSPVAINYYGITRTFQYLRIINQLTVKENILLSFKNNPGEKVFNAILPQRLFREKYREFTEQADQILEKVHLKEVENNLAGEISYGQQKLLTIGCGLANNADLLLLDEPVAGIDKENYEKIYGLILRLKEEGKTVIQIELFATGSS